MQETGVRIQAEDLTSFLVDVFAYFGVPPADARLVAGLMVEADLRGYDTHGVFRLRQYVNRLRDGGIAAKSNIKIVQETAATALVDGGNGLGHLAMKTATDLAIHKAKASGIGWVGVRNGNHAGPAALYVRPQTQEQMIGLCAAVGSANHVAPYGGSDLLLGTNPLAIAVPAGAQEAFVLDMATTNAAMGKIKTLAQRGEPMPEGWMVGRDGKPLTDPNRRDDGFLLPIGGPKGYGLAMAIGLLAGSLNGAAFGSDVVDFSSDTTSPSNTGQFVAAISIEAFGDPSAFGTRVEKVFDEVRASEPLPDHAPVRIPGQERDHRRQSRMNSGIPLHPNLLNELRNIADEISIPPLQTP